jgi:hypothetical protein
MPTKKKTTRNKRVRVIDGRASAFKARIHDMASKVGMTTVDDVVAASKGALKYASTRKYWDGHRFPRPEQLFTLSRVFNCTVAELLGPRIGMSRAEEARIRIMEHGL